MEFGFYNADVKLTTKKRFDSSRVFQFMAALCVGKTFTKIEQLPRPIITDHTRRHSARKKRVRIQRNLAELNWSRR